MDFSQHRFVFSTLLPHPKIVFKCSNTTNASLPPVVKEQPKIIPKPTSQFNQFQINIDIPRGVLTLQYCEMLLKELIKNKDLSSFKKSVNPNDASNYYNVIKNPMDFETLLEQLLNGTIVSINHFKDNLDLIWENCRHYNGPNDPLTRIANEAKNAIDRIWKECTLPRKSDVVNDLRELDTYLNNIQNDFIKVVNPNIIRNRPIIPAPKITNPTKEQTNKKPKETPPTYVQLKEMAVKIANTPPSKCKEAWNILIPFLKDKELTVNMPFSLKDLPKEAQIELKKVLIAC